jgi:DNA-binding MarR family transcriptional regulator
MKPQPVSAQEPLSKTRLRLWLRLLKMTGHVEAELRRRLRERHDTTLPRFDVMAALSRHPEGLKMSGLSQFLKVSNGNVTGIVERLVSEGLAHRVVQPGDRRAQIVRLTAKGEETFATMAADHEAWIDELMGGLSAEDARQMTALLQRAQITEAGT